MFTGIIEEAGIIESIRPSVNGIQLTVGTTVCGNDLKIGDSLAVNGCCLTATKITGRGKKKSVQLDLLQETWTRTNLQHARAGATINLERALRADGRFGGHFVTGHIDGMGKIMRWEQSGADYVLEIAAAPDILRHVIFKGSIAVDGISLTISAVTKKNFQIWIIPHTFAVTALRERAVGDFVNLEGDLLGKYVDRMLTLRSSAT